MAEAKSIKQGADRSIFRFADNRQARLVCGVCDENLALLEESLPLRIHMRGHWLTLSGEAQAQEKAQKILAYLGDLAQRGANIGKAEIEAALSLIPAHAAAETGAYAADNAAAASKADGIKDAYSAANPHSAAKDGAEGAAAMPSSASAPQAEADEAAGSAARRKKQNLAQEKADGALKAANKAAGQNAPRQQPAAFASIITRKKHIYARNPAQNAYIAAMQEAQLIFGLGPAGTGKTYLAVAFAASLLEKGLVERIILSRPAVEAGERLGFLPGDMKEKIDPYLRPLYDALYDMMAAEKIERALAGGIIEIAPLAFMRGRTLAHSAIILDEAQNATSMQMKMLLTRLGEGAHMVINGDPSQVDLPAGQVSGLTEAAALLDNIENIACIRFSDKDVVRHPLVAAIIRAYAQKSPLIGQDKAASGAENRAESPAANGANAADDAKAAESHIWTGERVKALRGALKLKQGEFGAVLGFAEQAAQTQISSWENDGSVPEKYWRKLDNLLKAGNAANGLF